MASGRGAWTRRGKRNLTGSYARVRDLPRDGVTPEKLPPDPLGIEAESDVAWFDCVTLGVVAIQRLLVWHGEEPPLTDDVGEFRARTRDSVENFQHNTAGLSADGIVGGLTMRALIRPIVVSAAQHVVMSPRWLWGLATMESGFDPAAQGWTTPNDLGLWQHNTTDGVPTIEQAFDPEFAAFAAARRFSAAMGTFDGKGHKMAVDCAIMQHRSPTAASHLYHTGDPLGPESEAYVENVRDFARAW